MWNSIMSHLKPGQRLLTPGRGIPAIRQKPFFVVAVAPTYIGIEIGDSRTFNRLPKEMFDAIDRLFRDNPLGYLRVAAEHANVPTEKSVDEIARSAVHFNRAIGNYVAAILEEAGCVRYVMKGNRKCVERP
ncbi:MAG: hypothetical protein JW883_09975 [Deltaproteobacteria bacterium]|nr:hypothetical protein [Deltaproteobacteria bacterium]